MTIQLIEIKEINYPGKNDVSRMRELIIQRKRDFERNPSINLFK